MAEPFLAETRIFSFAFAPKGWATCDGQLLPINQNQALFSLLGTTYGGDGRVNFALPDLRGRVPMHTGNGHTQGERGGEQAHTLSQAELPAHTHLLQGAELSPSISTGGMLPQTPRYASELSSVALAAGSLTSQGGSQAHLNMQPFLTLNFCIALQGIFPSQS
ncbi:phage tail protein [Holophaga foetida]|uniref:phage tail protein n=1 Tax=Holophaga foetida TaxID=35839 RepID=UPI000247465E|nr:tail fiber protein [Holophaga foetida]